MTITVNWEQATSYAAATDRLALASLLTKTAPNTGRSGVIPSTGADLAVTAQGTPNMTVAVAAGQCALPSAAGNYIGNNSASLNVTITTANGTNPRIDLIVFQVLDTEAGDGSTTGQIVAVAGTAASSPSAPATPARSIVLAQVRVDAGVTSIVSGKITDTRAFTVSSGGILPAASSSAYLSSPYEGAYADDATLNGLVRYDGSNWQPVTTDTGWQNITLAGSWAVANTLTPRARKIGNRVFWEGNASGGATTSQLGTLPSSCWPARTRSLGSLGLSSPYGPVGFVVSNVGAILCYFAAGGPQVSLDGVSYLVD